MATKEGSDRGEPINISTDEQRGELRRKAKRLVESLVEAYERYDDPDDAAEYEAYEAEREKERAELYREFYTASGQKSSDETFEQAIARMASYFAERIARDAPATGEFTEMSQPLPRLDAGGIVEMNFGASPYGDALRFLELEVKIPSEQSSSKRFLKQGSNAEVEAFLRATTTPAQIITLANELGKQMNLKEYRR